MSEFEDIDRDQQPIGVEKQVNPKVFAKVYTDGLDLLKRHPETKPTHSFSDRSVTGNTLSVTLEDGTLMTLGNRLENQPAEWFLEITYPTETRVPYDVNHYTLRKNNQIVNDYTVLPSTGCIDDDEADKLARKLEDVKDELERNGTLLPLGQNKFVS